MIIKELFNGADMRCEELLKAMEAIIYERGEGIPIPSIIGTIEILKSKIMEDSK